MTPACPVTAGEYHHVQPAALLLRWLSCSSPMAQGWSRRALHWGTNKSVELEDWAAASRQRHVEQQCGEGPGIPQQQSPCKPSLPTLGSHHNSPSGPAQLRTFSRNSEELPEGLTPNHPPPLVPSMFTAAPTEKEEWLLPRIRVQKLHNRALMQKRLLMFVLSFDALLLIPHFLVRKYFFMVGKCGWETNT